MEEKDAATVNGWVERARGGDEGAFGELVTMYHPRIYAVIRRMIDSADDARELEQITWVKAWQRLGSYRQDARFFTWLYRIAINTTMDHIRQKARQREVSLTMDDGEDQAGMEERPVVTTQTAVDEIGRAEVMQAFQAALGDLSPEHRAALVLREVEGRSYQEIADAMKCRIGTVMSRIFYARKTIQDKMRDLQ